MADATTVVRAATPEPTLSAGLGTGIFWVVLAAAISGVSTFVNFSAVAGTSSDAFVTVRNVAVALLLVPIAYVSLRARPWEVRRLELLALVGIGVVGGGVAFLLFFHGLALAAAQGGAATASFGYRTLFLMAAVLGFVALGERLPGRAMVAAALLLIGTALLMSFTQPIWTDGTMYVLGATALWAGEYTLARRLLRRLPTMTVVASRMGFGAIFLTVYLAATGQVGAVARFGGSEWEWVGISAALLAAFVLTWYPGLRRMEVGPASAVLTIGLPITWALSIVVLGAAYTPSQALGAIAIVAGALLYLGAETVRRAVREGAKIVGRARGRAS